jgi:hypothetical protein
VETVGKRRRLSLTGSSAAKSVAAKSHEKGGHSGDSEVVSQELPIDAFGAAGTVIAWRLETSNSGSQ